MASSGKDNLEANIQPEHNSQLRSRSHSRHVFILLAILGSTITFYTIFGVLLLFHYSDDASSSLLALISSSPKLDRYLNSRPVNSPFHAYSKSNLALFQKPEDINIVAVVGYRNWERSSILDCYLQKNLVEHGGLLDKVEFVPETTEQIHLEWLYETANKSDSYSIGQDWTHSSLHNHNGEDNTNADNNTIYIKIDGDVVYIEDNVIPTIVNTKLQHPEMGIVSANVVHQPAVAEFHRRPGVVISHLTDLKSMHGDSKSSKHHQDWPILSTKWREWVSHEHSQDATKKSQKHESGKKKTTTKTASAGATEKYTWLSQAQQHNSFLHHLEHGELQTYKFPMWKNPAGKISGAFICGTGADIASFTTDAASSYKKQNMVIDGKGVVSHYDNMAGLDGLDSTNVLERYRSYAENYVCPRKGDA